MRCGTEILLIALMLQIDDVYCWSRRNINSEVGGILDKIRRSFGETEPDGEVEAIPEQSNNWHPSSTVFKGVKVAVAVPENTTVPWVSCPSVFQYRYAYEFGGFFGAITTQKPYAARRLELEVNMTIDRPINHMDNIKLIVLSTPEELYMSDVINWAVILPYQDLLPVLTSVRFNDRVLCRNDPGIAMPGTYRAWIGSRIVLELDRFGEEDDESTTPNTVRVVRDGWNGYANVMNKRPPIQSPGYGVPIGEYSEHSRNDSNPSDRPNTRNVINDAFHNAFFYDHRFGDDEYEEDDDYEDEQYYDDDDDSGFDVHVSKVKGNLQVNWNRMDDDEMVVSTYEE